MTHKDFVRWSNRIVEGEYGCWIWTGTDNGNDYPTSNVGSKQVYVYKEMYEYLKGPIPYGKEPDHICRIRKCINPAHIEPVTHRENMKRGKTIIARQIQSKTCPNGHPYSGVNNRGDRICHPCYAEVARAYRQHKKARVS